MLSSSKCSNFSNEFSCLGLVTGLQLPSFCGTRNSWDVKPCLSCGFITFDIHVACLLCMLQISSLRDCCSSFENFSSHGGCAWCDRFTKCIVYPDTVCTYVGPKHLLMLHASSLWNVHTSLLAIGRPRSAISVATCCWATTLVYNRVEAKFSICERAETTGIMHG